MNLEILVSTMNRTSLDFLEVMFPYQCLNELSILVINQTQQGLELKSKFSNVRIINSQEIGLSKSRNLAIENAIGDICLIADDDTVFVKEFEHIIKDAFTNYSNASVIQFKIETFTGEDYKRYQKKSKKLSRYSKIIHSSSIELAFKRQDINNRKIRFNELFGLGSVFKSGEEFLFLKDVLDNNLNVYFEDKTIVKHSLESSTMVGSENYIKSLSVIYYIIYGSFSKFYILKLLFFLFRKRLLKIKDLSKKYTMSMQSITYYKKIRNS